MTKGDSLDIRDMVALAYLADLRNFGAAADKLNTTQPTLSRIISSMEEKLGVPLFRRGWTGAEATTAGELVSHHAREVLNALQQTQCKLWENHPPAPNLPTTLSLSQLEVIDAVRRNGGATAAARELGRSQPSVSRVIREFQDYMQLDLFVRNRRGLTARPAATALSELLVVIRNRIERMLAQVEQQKGLFSGRVAIGVLSFSEQDLVPKVFARISESYPLVRLAFVPGTYSGLVDALRLGEIDGFVGILRGERCPADLTETRLFEERFTIVARKDHPAHSRAKSVEDLAQEKWLIPPYGSPVRDFFEKTVSEKGLSPLVQTCEIQFFSAVEEMLADGNAIGIQTYSDAKLATLRPELKPIELPLPDNRVPIALTTFKSRRKTPVFEEFLRLIRQMSSAHL